MRQYNLPIWDRVVRFTFKHNPMSIHFKGYYSTVKTHYGYSPTNITTCKLHVFTDGMWLSTETVIVARHKDDKNDNLIGQKKALNKLSKKIKLKSLNKAIWTAFNTQKNEQINS